MRLSQKSILTRPTPRHAPQLWTIIDGAVLGHASRMLTHLARFGQRSLDLFTDQSESGPIFPTLAPLVSHVHRWRLLHLWGMGEGEIEWILAALRGLHAPILEELSVILSFDAHLPLKKFVVFQGGTPSLKEFCLRRVVCLPAAIHTLTHLEMKTTAFQKPIWTSLSFADMIKKMRSLTHIALEGSVVAPADEILDVLLHEVARQGAGLCGLICTHFIGL
ncbi:hypothetical protein HWV62_37653 [Athelia sp. TMB]|nr:hypothetical protein HWV62_37653 [Athelia sp. TMB]